MPCFGLIGWLVKNGCCRMHGTKSTGAPNGNRNAEKHGNYSTRELLIRMLLRSGRVPDKEERLVTGRGDQPCLRSEEGG